MEIQSARESTYTLLRNIYENSRIFPTMFANVNDWKPRYFAKNWTFFSFLCSKFYFRLLFLWNWRLFLLIFHKYYKWHHILYLRLCVRMGKHYSLFIFISFSFMWQYLAILLSIYRIKLSISSINPIAACRYLAYCNNLQMHSIVTYKECDTPCRIKRINFIHRLSVSSYNFQTG